MTNYKSLETFKVKGIENWGIGLSDDYKSFQTKYKNFLKRVCKENGYELVSFMPSHYKFSCFIKGNEKFVYISISDVRFFRNEWFNNILIRTAESEKDYHGGVNQYTSLPCLEAKIKSMFAEYGDVCGSNMAYAYWNKTGNRYDDETIIA